MSSDSWHARRPRSKAILAYLLSCVLKVLLSATVKDNSTTIRCAAA
jgi:hypothetical protein